MKGGWCHNIMLFVEAVAWKSVRAKDCSLLVSQFLFTTSQEEYSLAAYLMAWSYSMGIPTAPSPRIEHACDVWLASAKSYDPATRTHILRIKSSLFFAISPVHYIQQIFHHIRYLMVKRFSIYFSDHLGWYLFRKLLLEKVYFTSKLASRYLKLSRCHLGGVPNLPLTIPFVF